MWIVSYHCAGAIETRQGRSWFVIVLCNVRREMLLLVPNHPYQRLAVTVVDILLVLMLSTCGTKGPVMTAKQTPKMRPWRRL